MELLSILIVLEFTRLYAFAKTNTAVYLPSQNEFYSM